MPAPSSPSTPAGDGALREIRFSLRDMLAEVATDRLTGAFGTEKLRQEDVKQLFRAKPRKPRGRT